MTITLYKKDSKDRIRVWYGSVEGDEVVTKTGLVDGKLKEERRRAKPKNVGNSNETTGEEQAKLELTSKANKERDKGYFDTIEEAQNNVVVLPMLAHKYKERKKHVKFPCFVQPKLDGVRCVARLKNGDVTLFSRKGKPFPPMPSLMKDLGQISKKLGDREIFLDGELFSIAIPFEELSGHCRRSLASHDKKGTTHLLDLISLNVFDCYHPQAPDATFEKRWELARKVVGGAVSEGGCVQMVANTEARDDADVHSCHDQYVNGGHEGIIVRNKDGKYKLNARSNDLLKMKDFIDEEFEIVGYEEGAGRDEGTVIWLCVTADERMFRCRPRGTHELRADWYQNGQSYVGKKLTVRYQELTEQGIPRFPVGIAIRDYE